MSVAVEKAHIDADEIFLGIYLYTKEKHFFEVFWKFLGSHDVSDIQEYIDTVYNLKKDSLKGDFSATLQMQPDMHVALQDLRHNHDTKQTFIALLYISLDHLSVPFATYLDSHNIDMESVKNKLHMLLHNPVVRDMGVVAFFGLINKLMKKLNLSLNDISMMQFETKESIDSLLNAMDHDFMEEGDTNDTQESAIKTTTGNKKEEDKKLTIEFFGTDLTQEARDNMLDPVIGRDKEIHQMIYTLLRKTKNNPLLIGEA